MLHGARDTLDRSSLTLNTGASPQRDSIELAEFKWKGSGKARTVRRPRRGTGRRGRTVSRGTNMSTSGGRPASRELEEEEDHMTTHKVVKHDEWLRARKR